MNSNKAYVNISNKEERLSPVQVGKASLFYRAATTQIL